MLACRHRAGYNSISTMKEKMLLEILLILPLYVALFLICWRYSHIINMADALENFLDQVDTPKEAQDQSKKREFLRALIESGQPLPGKTPWTVKRLDEASDKTIDKLYVKMMDSPSKDLMSRVAGVDNVKSMMHDINSNFLIKNQASEMIGKFTPTVNLTGNTPMEVLGSHLYEKCGVYLAPVSLFCTVWNHLDWQTFARIAEQRKSCPPKILNDVMELQEENGELPIQNF